jgi:hypothetical protein
MPAESTRSPSPPAPLSQLGVHVLVGVQQVTFSPKIVSGSATHDQSPVVVPGALWPPIQ